MTKIDDSSNFILVLNLNKGQTKSNNIIAINNNKTSNFPLNDEVLYDSKSFKLPVSVKLEVTVPFGTELIGEACMCISSISEPKGYI